MVAGARGTPAAVPIVSAFSNMAPSADMHIKIIKAEVEEQWGGTDPCMGCSKRINLYVGKGRAVNIEGCV